VKGAGPPPAVPSPGDAALLALVRQSAAGGGGGGVRLYTEQDLLEGRAKGHHQMQQQQQRPRFSHPAIPPPLLRVRTSFFFLSVLWIGIDLLSLWIRFSILVPIRIRIPPKVMVYT
jgi:hypothetical protein